MRIHVTVEPLGDSCPEDDATNGWLEETGVYVSVATGDDGDVEDPPAEV